MMFDRAVTRLAGNTKARHLLLAGRFLGVSILDSWPELAARL